MDIFFYPNDAQLILLKDLISRFVPARHRGTDLKKFRERLSTRRLAQLCPARPAAVPIPKRSRTNKTAHVRDL